jgi:predicted ribosomally synthesized peptide with nif11-like leader
MIQNIKEMLQNAQLQQQVKAATNLVEAIKLIVSAGAEKGYSFSQESVAQAIDSLMSDERELSEEDLLAVAGGLMCAMACCPVVRTATSAAPTC